MHELQATAEEFGKDRVAHRAREAIFRELVDNTRALDRCDLTACYCDEKRIAEEPRGCVDDRSRLTKCANDGHSARFRRAATQANRREIAANAAPFSIGRTTQFKK
jgi:hypothetical protein